MPRSRLGIALVLPEPARSEVFGLRRALGCPSLNTQPPHVTLVPPVNVPEDDVAQSFELVRYVCMRTTSLTLRLGPIETFAPVSLLTEVFLLAESYAVDEIRVAKSPTSWVNDWLRRRSFGRATVDQLVRLVN